MTAPIIETEAEVPTEPGSLTVTIEEGRAIFDEEVRRVLGIGGDEFLRRWDAGEYREIADTPGNLHLIHLAMLIPLAR